MSFYCIFPADFADIFGLDGHLLCTQETLVISKFLASQESESESERAGRTALCCAPPSQLCSICFWPKGCFLLPYSLPLPTPAPLWPPYYPLRFTQFVPFFSMQDSGVCMFLPFFWSFFSSGRFRACRFFFWHKAPSLVRCIILFFDWWLSNCLLITIIQTWILKR